MSILITCKCGVTFKEKPSHSWRKYCSRKCGYKYRDMTALKGRKITYTSPHPAWELMRKTGEEHRMWKGDAAGYRAIHIWINNRRPRKGVCDHCLENKRTGWANISGDYKRELDDWVELCYKCHRVFDRDKRGAIARRFQCV